MKQIRVRVPATTANLGPGFDCLGCALSMYADFTCEIIPEGLEITGCSPEFRNADNLFVAAYRRMEDRLGIPHAGLRLDIHTDVPVSRGLGSSATLLAAGAYACNALNGDILDKQAVLEICNEIEGHPDNVAPCVFGGMITSLVQDGVPISAPVPVSGAIGFVALIPDFEVSTKAARAVLPTQLSRADAVFNISRLGVLIRAFETGDLKLIGCAMDDRLHQPYRRALIDEYDQAERAAIQAGAAAFCISGSGSACLAVADVHHREEIAQSIRGALKDSPHEWRIEALTVDRQGAHIAP